MPSPIGHALAGLAAGCLVRPPHHPSRDASVTPHTIESGASVHTRLLALLYAWRLPIAYAVVATLPDVDLVVHRHSRETHSLGVALIVGVVAWLVVRKRVPDAVRIALAFGMAYASHVLLDWLGDDTSPPLGIMALWPLTDQFYLAPLHIFGGISRRYWLWEAWTGNATAAAREVLILVPIAAAVVWRQCRTLARETWMAVSGPGR